MVSPGGTKNKRQTTMEDNATQPLGCWKAEFRNKRKAQRAHVSWYETELLIGQNHILNYSLVAYSKTQISKYSHFHKVLSII